jgi:hypothetical protein
VYATSATLYRALTGYKPPEAAARILNDELAPPNELVPSLSDAPNDAILKGLSVRPDDRPQSEPRTLASLPSAARSVGVPKMVRSGDHLYAAWVAPTDTASQVQTIRIPRRRSSPGTS